MQIKIFPATQELALGFIAIPEFKFSSVRYSLPTSADHHGTGAFMIEINWKNDDRNRDVEEYMTKERRTAFLSRWAIHLKNPSKTTRLEQVRWGGLGLVYASILGDIPHEQRKELYLLLLTQYLASDRMKHWTDEQRKEALRIAADA